MSDGKPNYKKRSLFTKENFLEGIRYPHKIFLSLYNRTRLSILRWYYVKKKGSYTDFYLKATKDNIDEDPKGSVGPADLFEEVGEWQFQLLKRNGLEPEDSLLDIGCGVLRGGIHFIKYLQSGNYYGMDISEEALEKGEEFLRKEGLEYKDPVLICNQDLSFEEKKLQNKKFDFILAQSVFTHLPRKEIKQCLDNIHKVLSDDGTFYATFNKSTDDVYVKRRGIDRFHTLKFYEELASETKVQVKEVPSNHPNGLSLLQIQTN
ncbi:MAG: cyclopropane-fatty-acyl-phospholipid synthase family protein [Halobacteriaceae archaeon]